MGAVTNIEYYKTGLKKLPSIGQLPKLEAEYLHYINVYENKLLSAIFSPTQYNELILALDDLDAGDVKYKNLVIGETYIIDGIEKRFNGLRGLNNESLVAYYVYCNYMDDKSAGNLNTIGVTKPNVDGANYVNDTPLFLKCWNDKFLYMYQKPLGYEDAVYYEIDGHYGVDYSRKGYDTNNISLEEYLEDKSTLFDGYNFMCYEGKNSFGI